MELTEQNKFKEEEEGEEKGEAGWRESRGGGGKGGRLGGEGKGGRIWGKEGRGGTDIEKVRFTRSKPLHQEVFYSH